MKYATQTAAQLIKLINRRPMTAGVGAAHVLAERIEGGLRKTCIPKAKLRRLGLLPAVGSLEQIEKPSNCSDYPGCIIGDRDTYFMIIRPINEGEEFEGEKVDNSARNKWWAVSYPDKMVKMPAIINPGPNKGLKWYRRKASPCVSAPSVVKS
jgi:hypothetical protein